MPTEEEALQHVLATQDIIECPVCFKTMDSTLKLCINGHGICSSCAEEIHKCPTCDHKFSDIVQNTLLAKILEFLPKPCAHIDYGCRTVVLDREHEIYCKYRIFPCLTLFCDWDGCCEDFLEHMRECSEYGDDVNEVSLNHPVKQVYSFGGNEKAARDQTCFVVKNEVFVKLIFFRRRGSSMLVTLRLLYIPTSKPLFKYFMVVSFKKGPIEFTYTCPASIVQNRLEFNLLREENDDYQINIPVSVFPYFQQKGINYENECTFTIFKEEISP